MHVCWDVRRFCSRLQDLANFRRKEKKPVLVISAPFNFKKEGSILPGMSEDEVTLLREKAAASRIGVVEEHVAATDNATAHAASPQPMGLPTTVTAASALGSHSPFPAFSPSASRENLASRGPMARSSSLVMQRRTSQSAIASSITMDFYVPKTGGKERGMGWLMPEPQAGQAMF
ncbi:hypothetical protein VTK73DRAFT_2023 [Phialemonium thermophilum]|uniref:Uncharacterized protein n=1 Tax=Phialemonium thermophilum TaxID=223376 RepID=A0ABR3VSV6_9PEZI